MATWIKGRETAERLGVTRAGIAQMVLAGRLTSGPRTEDGIMTVDEAAVAAYRSHTPPDDEHTWLTSSEAARLVGITKQAMNQRCAHD